jgi:UDP-galactopyranose mutase
MKRVDELDQRIRELLQKLGLIQKQTDIILAVRNYLDHAYPIHDLGRQPRVTSLLHYLKSRNVWSIGRFGSWRYSSIDDAIGDALEAAQAVSPAPWQPAPEAWRRDQVAP